MGLSIMIVDDSPIARKIVKKCLSSGDYRIIEASSGQECLDLYGKEGADVVFLDLTMPKMNGMETLTRLKAMDPQVKVIVISADVQPKAREEALERGAVAFLSKPAKETEIKEVILEKIVGGKGNV